MTVESIYTDKKLLGLKTRQIRRVLDFRSYSIKESPVITIIHSSPLELLNPQELHKNAEEGDALNTDMQFVKPISEDSVETYVWNARENKHKDRKVLTGPAINEANLTSDDGKLKIIWRETQEGDYPPLPEEASVNPIQTVLGLA